MKYCIPDCFWPEGETYIYESHEAFSILNIMDHAIAVEMTLYFEDRDKMSGFKLIVPAERTIHFHDYDLKNSVGLGVPRGVGFAAVFESLEPVFIQYTRVDTTQEKLALGMTMAEKME